MSSLKLEWDSEQSKALRSSLGLMLQKQILVDMTLICSTHTIRVHKVVLAANSSYIESVALQNKDDLIVVMRKMSVGALRGLVEFMYQGKTNVLESDIDEMLIMGKHLGVAGLKYVTRQGFGLEAGSEITKLEPPIVIVSSSNHPGSNACSVHPMVIKNRLSSNKDIAQSNVLKKVASKTKKLDTLSNTMESEITSIEVVPIEDLDDHVDSGTVVYANIAKPMNNATEPEKNDVEILRIPFELKNSKPVRNQIKEYLGDIMPDLIQKPKRGRPSFKSILGRDLIREENVFQISFETSDETLKCEESNSKRALQKLEKQLFNHDMQQQLVIDEAVNSIVDVSSLKNMRDDFIYDDFSKVVVQNVNGKPMLPNINYTDLDMIANNNNISMEYQNIEIIQTNNELALENQCDGSDDTYNKPDDCSAQYSYINEDTVVINGDENVTNILEGYNDNSVFLNSLKYTLLQNDSNDLEMGSNFYFQSSDANINPIVSVGNDFNDSNVNINKDNTASVLTEYGGITTYNINNADDAQLFYNNLGTINSDAHPVGSCIGTPYQNEINTCIDDNSFNAVASTITSIPMTNSQSTFTVVNADGQTQVTETGNNFISEQNGNDSQPGQRLVSPDVEEIMNEMNIHVTNSPTETSEENQKLQHTNIKLSKTVKVLNSSVILSTERMSRILSPIHPEPNSLQELGVCKIAAPTDEQKNDDLTETLFGSPETASERKNSNDILNSNTSGNSPNYAEEDELEVDDPQNDELGQIKKMMQSFNLLSDDKYPRSNRDFKGENSQAIDSNNEAHFQCSNNGLNLKDTSTTGPNNTEQWNMSMEAVVPTEVIEIVDHSHCTNDSVHLNTLELDGIVNKPSDDHAAENKENVPFSRKHTSKGKPFDFYRKFNEGDEGIKESSTSVCTMAVRAPLKQMDNMPDHKKRQTRASTNTKMTEVKIKKADLIDRPKKRPSTSSEHASSSKRALRAKHLS